MSAFQVTITPTRIRNKRSESRTPTLVCMAPFSAKSIVEFEDVPLTKTAKRMLRILNPANEDIEVRVTKAVPVEHNLSIEWTECVVEAQSEVEMEMIWVPQMDVACKEKMQLTDNRNFQKEVEIVFKSKTNNAVKPTRRFPTISSTTNSTQLKTTLRLKSPKNNLKTTKKHNTSSSTQQSQQKIRIEKTDTNTKTITRKSFNTAAARKMKVIDKGGSNELSAVVHVSPLSESNAFAKNAHSAVTQCRNLNVSPMNENEHGNEENISPLTPNNIMNMIDNLNFTPATTTLNTPLQKNYLAFLPTPVNTTITKATNSGFGLRPRKLTDADLGDKSPSEQSNIVPEICVENCQTPLTTISNKTFEIQHTEELNITQDLLDTSTTTSGISVTMNRTTTIQCTPMGRTLTVIREEDDFNCSVEKSSLSIDNSAQDLKRDIKLVGTPLRKPSESMKNLSVYSPKNKIAIQGSMPNLNDMESIRSIEQNRYFHQHGSQSNITKRMSTVHEQNSPTHLSVKNDYKDVVDLSSSRLTNASNTELNFDLTEIRAQSSRFNINEVGLGKSKNRSSPIKASNGLGATKKYTKWKNEETLKTIKPIGTKRSVHELSFTDAPSTESLISNDSFSFRANRRASTSLPISPPKRQRVDSSFEHNFLRPTPVNASASRKDWSRVQPKKFAKLSKTLSLTKKNLTPSQMKIEPRIKLYDPETFLRTCINPDPFAATTTCDPFLASTMYLDQKAVERHQIDFRKWLNALVTMPADLDADTNTKIDVGRLFNEVRNKELTLAPTKEEQSMNYLTKFRLDSLRRAAVELFMSESMSSPCSKVAVYISKQAIRIRQDRNLHLDVVMQRNILELLLCFNPLWLRLGLEVVFGEQVHLQSNRDIVGLSTFILNRLFRDRFLEQKYSKAYTLSEEYAEHIKKFTLQKILFLLLFLDQAKLKRIIKHNPCLFVKKSPYKETKDILLRFSSELLANIGDIRRELKRFGYVLQHKQNFLDEFDYAFNNLAVDLRDGVRLTRVMEIILLRDDLSQQLRVPAISRLQRIFNVNLALRALNEADFQLSGEITAADIVDGHREKTLSLLWQIIYKFRSPKFHAAARTVQKWWRLNWLRIFVRRRIKQKELERRELAATKIQAQFRGFLTRRFYKTFKAQRLQAAITLQKYVRGFLVQQKIKHQNNAAWKIQRAYQAHLLKKNCRQKFVHLRECTIYLQRVYRRRLLSRKLTALAEAARRQRDQKLQAAAAYIQDYWRAYREMRQLRAHYMEMRQAALILQQRYRATIEMRQVRNEFLMYKLTVNYVQEKFRSKQIMRQERQKFQRVRTIVVKLQQRRRAQLQMRAAVRDYKCQRSLIIKLQQRVRAFLAMKAQRNHFQKQRAAACVLQQRYRARLAMKVERNNYKCVRDAVIVIQRKWQATMLARRVRVEYLTLQYTATLVQQKYRATKLMRVESAAYVEYRSAVVTIQRRYRAKREMLNVRTAYQHKLQCIIAMQRRLRANKQMRFQRAKFQGTRNAALCLQQHFRNYLLMKQQRGAFVRLRTTCLAVQVKWRAKLAMRVQRQRFLGLRTATVAVQQRYRAKLEMHKQQSEYQRKHQLIIAMQRRYRAKLLGTKVHQQYQQQRLSIIKLQQRFRAKQKMCEVRNNFLAFKENVTKIQRYYRSRLRTKQMRLQYVEKRKATQRLQQWYRAILKTRQQQSKYQQLRTHIIRIQQKWRATLAARKERIKYLGTHKKIVLIQQKLRATYEMRKVRFDFHQKKSAAIVLQQRYRARLEMLKIRSQYQLILSLTICIQRKFRAHRAMRCERGKFLLLKRTAVHLQQKLRGKRLMHQARVQFLRLRQVMPNLQAHARGLLARRHFQAMLTPEMIELWRQKRAAKIVQRFWRGYRVRKRLRNACIQQIRRNIIASKSTANVMNTLRYKLMDSVRILKGRFSVAEVLNVLQRLERLSRTVPHLLTLHADFISTFCYGIMAQAIRSEIDKQMIELCSCIILNLARYDSINANTFQQNGLVTIAQMLLRWCDKDCEIFNTLCTLVWIFAHCQIKRDIIREFMTTPEAIYMLRETKKLVFRKEKMKLNDRRQLTCGHSTNSTRNTKQNSQKAFSKSALPSLAPDYGIIQNKPYTFISSVYAFDTLLCKLGIDVY